MSPILQFANVTKRYTRLDTALSDITFSIEKGEFTALSGPSGSGKTTILNLAAGLDSVNEGTIVLLKKELQQLSRLQLAQLRRKKIGFIFQEFNLFPVLTVIENIEYPLSLNRVGVKERRIRALEAMREVGLDSFEKRFPSELSGGQQQRVAIARAIVTEPSIIFADEPTANVDSSNAKSLLQLFHKLNDEKQITFLFSSHDPLVLGEAKRIITVTDGKIAEAKAK